MSAEGYPAPEGDGRRHSGYRPLTLLVTHHGPRRSWNIALAPLRPYVSRILLVEAGGDRLAPLLARALPDVSVTHLPLENDAGPGEWNCRLQAALNADDGWVLLLPAGCGVSVDRHLVLPERFAPTSILHRRRATREACWRPALVPARRGGLVVDAGGAVRVDVELAGDRCHPGLVIEERAGPSRPALQDSLSTTLSACRDGAGPAAALDAAELLLRLGRFHEAEFWYRQSLAGGAGGGRHWMAMYGRACCLLRLGRPWPAVEAAMAKAFDADPGRVEPLYHLARHYLECGDIRRSFELAEIGVTIEVPRIPHPFEFPVYQFELPRVYMAAALALGRDADCIREANRTLRRPGLTPAEREAVAGLRSRAVARHLPVYPLAIRRRNRIVVITPFRNAGSFLRGCVDSLASQDYTDCRFILIDDASTDGALDGMDISDPRFTVIRNSVRRGTIRNQLDAISNHCAPGDIVVYVDGDDRLTDDAALSYINDFFNSTRCLVMYGQYRDSQDRYGRCEPIVERSGSVLESVGPLHFPMHIRAHRAGLIGRLKQIDPALHRLRDDDGTFLDAVADMAIMRAAMQLAGLPRIRYNDRILYEYNAGNPESHYREVERRLQQDRQARVVQSRPPLPPADGGAGPEVSNSAPVTGKAGLLLVALDGMTPRLIHKWASEGLLPTLDGLIQTGRVRDIAVPRGFGNDVFWTSLATGVLPDQHGYYYRNCWCAAEHAKKLFDLENDLGAETFWERLAATDLEMAIIDLPEMKHAGRINGLEITEWITHARLGPPSFFPAALEADCTGRFGIDPTGGNTETMSVRNGRQFVKLRDRLLGTVEQKTRAALHYLDRGGWDLFALGYTQGHDAGHQFWHVHDSAHPGHRPIWRERYGDPLLQMYQAIDRGLGRLLERLGDPGRVMVVAGVAMEAKVSCNAALDEILWAIEQGELGMIRDGMTRRDLKQRRFFAVSHNNLSGAVRINLKGRETAAGVVERGEQYRRMLDLLQTALPQVVNADTGETVVEDFVRTQDDYTGDRVDDLPDLLVLWNRKSPIRRIASPWFDEVVLRPKGVTDTRSGDHVGNAEIIANFDIPFPGAGPVPVEAFAPALAALMKQARKRLP